MAVVNEYMPFIIINLKCIDYFDNLEFLRFHL